MRNTIAKAIKRKVFQAYYDMPTSQGDRSDPTRKDIKEALSDSTFISMVRRAKKSYRKSNMRLTADSQINLTHRNNRFDNRKPKTINNQ